MMPALLLATMAQTAPADVPAVSPRTRLAIMRLKAVGTPEGFEEGLTETLAAASSDTRVFDVVSPRQVAALLSFEKRKELLGGCVEEDCYLQVAKVVKADHVVGGSIAQVGDRLVLNLVLLDAARGDALRRANRETTSAAELLQEARRAVIVLLQPLLQERQGYLKVAVNVPGANLVVDDQRRAEAGGQVIPLAAGPHVLRVDMDGFYSTTTDVFVRPGRVTTESIKLIPAKETVEAYESRATWMRAGAWTTGVLAVGAAVGAGIFYAQASDNKDFTDQFSAALAVERDELGGYGRYLDERDAFDTNQGLYLGLLVGALVSGAVSTYLFIDGDDPGRYDEFDSLQQ